MRNLVLCFLATGLLLQTAVQGTAANLNLCDVVRGFAGSDNYQFAVNVNTAAWSIRDGESVVFVLRTPAEDDTIPAATISATYTAQDVPGSTTVTSDAGTGVLQLGPLGTPLSLTLTVINNAPSVETPFVLYSFHSNLASCAVPVQPSKIMSFPLVTSVTGATTPATASAIFALHHPPGMRHYSVAVLEGANSATLSTSNALASTQWVPTPAAPFTGDLPADPNPSTQQILFLKAVPNAVASPPMQTLRFQVTWSASAGAGPAPGSNNGGNSPIASGVPGIAPIPGATSAAGGTPAPTTADQAAGGEGSSVLWSMFVFFLVATVAYFVARTAYNVSQGEREFPKMVPHHEQIARGLAVIAGLINAAAAKLNLRQPFNTPSTVVGGSGSGYNDVDQDETL